MHLDAGLFRLLGDEGRLRLLRLVSLEQLNVTELTAILGLAQSGVSRHLGLLKDAGIVSEQRQGGFSYYALSDDVRDGLNGSGPLASLLAAQFADAAKTPAGRADDVRLEEIRRVRKENFDEHGAGDERRQIIPGRSWAAWARALGHLLPPVDVADLGCGDGYLAIEASRFAKRVVAVDHSDAVLTRARALARRRRVSNIEWKRGELENLPIPAGSVDIALLSQAVHHADEPSVAVAEAARILKPGGRVVVLDLRRHDQEWVRDRLGDKWLGFSDGELKRLLAGAGLTDIKLTIGARRAGDPFTVLIASGTKPLSKAHTKGSRHGK